MKAASSTSRGYSVGAMTKPVPITEVVGDWRRGNYRLSPISRRNTVWCLHAETMELQECAFSNGSGTWIAGDRGRFALVGQAITRDGEPGGEWVIAARIDDDGLVPGIDPVPSSTTAGFRCRRTATLTPTLPRSSTRPDRSSPTSVLVQR